MATESDKGANQANPPVLFFDRDVGIALPRALEILILPTQVEYHQNHFPSGAQDDAWMPVVGDRGWILIGHDSQHHRRQTELEAIRQHRIGCFYLWGTHAPRWEKMRCFLNAYERILNAAANTPKPFIYQIEKSGSLRSIPIR